MNDRTSAHPRIKRAQERVEKAEAALAAAVSLVQTTCAHSYVLEKPWRSCPPRGGEKPLRLCPCCGIEEEGSNMSGGNLWNRSDYGEALLGNSPVRVVVEVKEDSEFYRCRPL